MRIKHALDKSIHYESFEYLERVVSCMSQVSRLVVFYRPPTTSRNNAGDKKFMAESSAMLTSQLILPGKLIICGDINYHMEIPSDRNTMKLEKMMETMGIKQYVNDPTHEAGHTLDVVLERDTEEIVANVTVSEVQISDHHLIHFDLNLARPKPQQELITYRCLKKINKAEFRADLEQSLELNEADTVEAILERYKNTATTLLAKYALVKSRMITKHPNTPWYTDKLRDEKHKRRKLERKWKRTRSEADKVAYKKHCKAL